MVAEGAAFKTFAEKQLQILRLPSLRSGRSG
jgi:hypothetical protein